MSNKNGSLILLVVLTSLFSCSSLFSMPKPFQDQLQLTEDDIILPEKGVKFLFRRSYNGRTKFDGPMGIGWGFSFGSNVILDFQKGMITLKDGDGLITLFEKTSENEYRTKSNNDETIFIQSDGRIERRFKNEGIQIFGPDGLLEKIIDPYGHSFLLLYRDKNLSLILTPSGREINIQTNDLGKITAVSEPGGKKVEYQYSGKNELISVKDISGKLTTYAYDDRHDITEMTYPDGSKREITYKEDTGKIIQLKGPGEYLTKYEYFGLKGYRVTFASGYQVIYQDDLEKRQRIVSDNDGVKNILKYDEHDQLVESRDVLGRVSSFVYDLAGKIVEMTDPSGTKTEYVYGPDTGLLLSQKSNGRTALQYEYDTLGNVTAMKDSQGLVTQYKYDAHGLLETLTDPKGRITVYAYDSFGNVSQLVHSGNIRSLYQYDEYGRLLEETDPLGNKTSYAYDFAGNLIKSTFSNGLSIEYIYDEGGNRTKEIRSDGAFQEFVFDIQGRLVKKVNWESGISQFKYNEARKLTEEIKPNGSKNTYSYNITGLLTEEKDSLGSTTRFFYDGVGRLNKKIYPNGAEIEFSYDAIDRLISRKTSSGKTILWNYDPQGLFDEIVSGNDIMISHYDETGRLLSLEDRFLGLKTQFQYDAKGNVSEILYPNGDTLLFFYDELNRPVSIKTQEGQGVEYQYFEGKMDYTARYSNGVSEDYRFDTTGLLKDMLASFNKRPILGFTVSRNLSGAVTERQFLSGVTQKFEYDRMGRLVSFYQSDQIREKYRYDKNGNIISVERPKGRTSFSYDGADRLLSDGIFKFIYDSNGNMIKKTWNDGTISYTYNEDNKLTKVASSSGNACTYVYDAKGRRRSAERSGKSKKHYYVHENIAMDFDGGDLKRIYFHNLGVDHPIFFKEDGGVYFYHYDANGNVIALTNGKGEVVNRYLYGPFGNTIIKKESVENTFQFTAREYDETFGLYYYRERYYDPALFRFLSKDIIKSENSYIYADNDPINNRDPFGLATTFTPPQAQVNAIADGMGFNRPTYTPQISGVRAYGVHETSLLGNNPQIRVTREALNAGADQVRSTIFHENVHELQRLRNPMQYASSGSGTAAEAALEREAHMRTYEYAVRNGLSREVQQHSLEMVRNYGGTQAEMEAYMARVGTAIPGEASALSEAAGVLGRGVAVVGAAHMSFTAGYAVGSAIENRYHVGENMGIQDWELERQMRNQEVERREAANLDILESFVQNRVEVNQINLRPGVNLSDVRDQMQNNLDNGRSPLNGLTEKPEDRLAREQREREESYRRYEVEQARISSERRKKEEEFESNIEPQVQGLIGKAQGDAVKAQGITGKVQGAVQAAKNAQAQVSSIVNSAKGISGKIAQANGLLQGAQTFAASIQGLTLDSNSVIDAYGRAKDASQWACDIADNMQSVNDPLQAALQAAQQASLAQSAAAGVSGAGARAIAVWSNADTQLSQIRAFKQQVESIQSEVTNAKSQLSQLDALLQGARAAMNGVSNANSELQMVQASVESAKSAARGLLAPYLSIPRAQALLVQVNGLGSGLNGINVESMIQEAAASISSMEAIIGEVASVQEAAVPEFNIELGGLEGKVKDLRATADTIDLFESKIEAEVSRAQSCAGRAQVSQPRAGGGNTSNVNPPPGWSPVGDSVAGPSVPGQDTQNDSRQSADQQIDNNNQPASGGTQPGQTPQEPQQTQEPTGPDGHPPQGGHYPGDADGC